MEEKIFSSTGWALQLEGEEQNQHDAYTMPYMKSPALPDSSVIQAAPQRHFEFSSDMQRMSVVSRVVVEREEGFTQPATLVFCKGSPEMLARLCQPATLPADYDRILDNYASRGYRIIAIANKVPYENHLQYFFASNDIDVTFYPC